MTEKEAVEILKDMNDGYTFQDCRVCVSDNKFNEKKGICESKTCEYLNAIDTVIQALEQKDKEIQELKKDNQHQWDERCKLTFAYDKDTYTLQNQLDLANADRVEKDKIIDLMAEYIADEDTSTFICGDKIGCDEDCVECVLDFFQKKAREENE